MTAFLKMHGLGNDFVVFDARDSAFALEPGAGAAPCADRHFGIGCDTVVVIRARRRGRPTPACGSTMPMAAKWNPAATPRAASRGC